MPCKFLVYFLDVCIRIVSISELNWSQLKSTGDQSLATRYRFLRLRAKQDTFWTIYFNTLHGSDGDGGVHRRNFFRVLGCIRHRHSTRGDGACRGDGIRHYLSKSEMIEDETRNKSNSVRSWLIPRRPSRIAPRICRFSRGAAPTPAMTTKTPNNRRRKLICGSSIGLLWIQKMLLEIQRLTVVDRLVSIWICWPSRRWLPKDKTFVTIFMLLKPKAIGAVSNTPHSEFPRFYYITPALRWGLGLWILIRENPRHLVFVSLNILKTKQNKSDRNSFLPPSIILRKPRKTFRVFRR